MLDKNKELDQWGPVDAVALYFSFWLEPTAFGAFRKWGARWPEISGILNRKRLTFYWEKAAMNAGGFEAIEKILTVPEKKRELWESYQEVFQKLKESAAKIRGVINQKNPDFEAIAKEAVYWSSLLKQAWEIGVTPELANFGAPDYLRDKLKKFVSAGGMNSVLEILLAPEELSFHQASERDLFALAAASKGQPSVEDLVRYAERWHWVENSYFETKKLPAGYFAEKVRALAPAEARRKLTEIENYLRETKQKKAEICTRFKLPPEIAELSSILSHSIWWQDHRKGLAWWAADTIDILSRVAEKKFKISFGSILMYTANEWTELFARQKIVADSVIKERSTLTIFDCTSDGVIEYRGKEAEKILGVFEDEKNASYVAQIIKGTAVSKGRATGRVCVLLSPRNLDKMQDGNVLVTAMTSPDFIVAMRRASAVVTDVGGLMSHAAIISRELRVPCIVGTKIATKVLKDGDLVEVDASSGVVKKLN